MRHVLALHSCAEAESLSESGDAASLRNDHAAPPSSGVTVASGINERPFFVPTVTDEQLAATHLALREVMAPPVAMPLPDPGPRRHVWLRGRGLSPRERERLARLRNGASS